MAVLRSAIKMYVQKDSILKNKAGSLSSTFEVAGEIFRVSAGRGGDLIASTTIITEAYVYVTSVIPSTATGIDVIFFL